MVGSETKRPAPGVAGTGRETVCGEMRSGAGGGPGPASLGGVVEFGPGFDDAPGCAGGIGVDADGVFRTEIHVALDAEAHESVEFQKLTQT